MVYFKIGASDFSDYVKSLTVGKEHNYNAQTNAAGNTVVDYINKKRVITVGFRPLLDSEMHTLLAALEGFAVSVQYREPRTGGLQTASCIAPEFETDYYTIQSGKVIHNEFSVEFQEL